MTTASFRAYRVHEQDGVTGARFENLSLDDLAPGEVVIRAHYSSVNFKDALACTGKGRIMRHLPLVAGIDVAGEVVSSESARFKAGDEVLVTGCGLGEEQDGGFAEYVRVPADWVIPLPAGLTPFDAMALGTAGFTAALALYRMEQLGQQPALGPLLITGATGGVGGLAINLFSDQGYEVIALSGKPEQTDYLQQLGAYSVLDRHALTLGQRPLEKAQWGGAVDSVGGDTLAWLTRSVKPLGNIASIGMAASTELNTTVMPFILRGISLIGINSVNCPMPMRQEIWQRLAGAWRPSQLAQQVARTVTLDELPEACELLMSGKGVGRQVVTCS